MPLTLTWQERRELYQMLRPYLKNEKVQQMNTYIQHGSVSTLQHCKYVAEVSCWLNRRLHIGANPHALLVGALPRTTFISTIGTQMRTTNIRCTDFVIQKLPAKMRGATITSKSRRRMSFAVTCGP